MTIFIESQNKICLYQVPINNKNFLKNTLYFAYQIKSLEVMHTFQNAKNCGVNVLHKEIKYFFTPQKKNKNVIYNLFSNSFGARTSQNR